MRFLSLLLLLLANGSVCAPLFTKYIAVLAAFLAFRYSSVVPPFLHYFHAFSFSFTALCTSLFHHQVSLCRGHPPHVHPHISSAALRSPIWYIPKHSPLLEESVDISLTLPVQTPFTQQYISSSKFSFLVE